MICRLCLITINVEKFIFIFKVGDDDVESKIGKLIAKYLHLEISKDDAISTALCQDCWSKIDEFETFYSFIHGKQTSLRNEFLEVNCNALLDADKQAVANHQNEEALCDIKDFLHETPEVQLKCVSNEKNIFEDVIVQHGLDEKLSDDEISLQELKRRCVVKSKLKRVNKTKVFAKVKSATTNEAEIKLKKMKERGPAAKVRRKNSATVSEDMNNENSEVKNREINDFEHKIDERIENQTIEANREEQPKAIENKGRKSKYSLKYPGISTEDKYSFISQNMEMKCDICEASFKKFSEVRSHFRSQHKCRAYFKCCDRRHSRLQDIFEHIKWHFDPDFFKCDTCGKLLKNSVSLEVHKLNYHRKEEELVYSCKYCDKRFPRPFLLNNHVKSQHESSRSFLCEHCDKTFVLRKALATHIQSMHENIYPHICDTCGMKFKFKPSFEAHVLKHQGIVEPRIQCPECGYWAKNKNCLRLHLNSHNKTDVDCKHCGRTCASLSAMRAHIWHVHRRALNHKCTFCDKSFKRPKALKEHLAIHTGVSLYNCPHCVKEFRSSSNMYVHIKQKHTQEWLAAQSDQTKMTPKVTSS